MIKGKYDCEISYQSDESIYSEELKEEISDTIISIKGFQCKEAYCHVKKIVDKAIDFRIPKEWTNVLDTLK